MTDKSNLIEVEIKPFMCVGCIRLHPDGYNVYVTSGGEFRNNRPSNFWQWKRVFDDLSLVNEECGYGW